MISLRQSRYLVLGLFLVLSARSVAHAQTPAGQAPPTITPETAKVVQTALERALKAWGTAGVIDGAEVGPAAGLGGVALTGEAAAAGLALVQAAGLLTASGAALQLHAFRSASIVRYGNPYGMPASDIAFPLLRQNRAARAQQLTLPKPFAVPTPAPAPRSDKSEPAEPRPGRVYATYTRYNRTTGRYNSGRTSAVIDLNRDWDLQAQAAVRDRAHSHHTDENGEPGRGGFEEALLDVYAVGYAVDYRERYRDVGYLAIRGREQQLIDYHGGARLDIASETPMTDSAIRGVAKDNPLGELFHLAANLHFGELAAYTGHRRFDAQNP